MRIDLFLKKVLIFKHREIAKEMCEKGLVMINGKLAKASKDVGEGDFFQIETGAGVQRYRVLKIPEGNVRHNEVSLFYERIEE